MIPVPPLDGGNVLIGLLPHAGARLIEQIRPYGFIILYALMLTGILGSVLGPIPIGVTRFLLRLP
jgi:Zn-dependent protease